MGIAFREVLIYTLIFAMGAAASYAYFVAVNLLGPPLAMPRASTVVVMLIGGAATTTGAAIYDFRAARAKRRKAT